MIRVHPNYNETAFRTAKAGAVFSLVLHGLKYAPELRDNPPRIRLLEDGPRSRDEAIECELLDDWPEAPDYWPPEREPGVRPDPFSIHYSEQLWRQSPYGQR